MVFIRYAQARQKLHVIVFLCYLTLLLNVFLDWYMAQRFGAPGIALATTMVWLVNNGMYIYVLFPGFIGFMDLRSLMKQFLVSLGWSVPLYLFAPPSGFHVLLLAAILLFLHFLFCEKANLLSDLPQGWLPTELAKGIFSLISGRSRNS